MMRVLLVLALGLAAFLASPAATQSVEQDQRAYTAANWQIGPWIYWRKKWRNYSKGMPYRPTQSGENWYFDFPYPNKAAGHVHYVTFRHGPLEGAEKIRLKYRIDAAPDTRFVGQEVPWHEATLSLYFQRRGDRWKGTAPWNGYRWYAPREKMVPLKPGTHEVTIRLDEPWVTVLHKTRNEELGYFKRAIARTDRVGFVFGTKTRRGHGVYATAPARFTMLEFEVE